MKKIITVVSALTMMLALSICFTSSAYYREMYTDTEVYKIVDGVVYTMEDDHYKVVDFFATDELAKAGTEVNIVSEIDGIPVTEICTNYSGGYGGADYVEFDKYLNVKKVTLPHTIKEIGEFAFTFFPNVEELKIPESVEKIGAGAFCEMKSLKEVTLPEGITAINEYLFNYCIKLERVNIKGKIEEIGDGAFSGCEKLEAFDFQETLRRIGEFAFASSGLKEAYIPAYCELGELAFENCKNLKKLSLDVGMNDIKLFNAYEFSNCINLESIFIKSLDGKLYLWNDEYAPFGNCEKLKTIYFFGSKALFEEKITNNDTKDFLSDKKIHYYYEHTHSFIEIGENYTCKEGSIVRLRCNCGDEYKYRLEDSNTHNFTKWKTVKKATTKKSGKAERTCTACGKVESKKIAKLIKISSLKITLDKNSLVYEYSDGRAIKPEVTVKNGKTRLKAGKHYKLTYKNNKNIGVASVVIKGISENGYTGTKTVKFEITPTYPNPYYIKTSKITSSSIKFSWKKVDEATGYTIYFKDKKGNLTEIGTTKKTSFTVKNLKPGTKYDFTFKSYTEVDGKKIYSPGTSLYDIKTKK